MTWGVLPIRSTWPRRVATPTPHGKPGPRARGRSRHSPRGREARRWVARLRASLGRVYDPVQPAGGADAVTRAAHPWRWAPKNRPCLSTPLHTFRSLISMAMEGLKTLWLMPGGIVVARRVSGGASARAPRRAPHAWLPRGSCVAGVGVRALALVGTSVTPCALPHESVCATATTGRRHVSVPGASVSLGASGGLAWAGGAVASVAVLASQAPPSSCAQRQAWSRRGEPARLRPGVGLLGN
jgi:hypothetical protein